MAPRRLLRLRTTDRRSRHLTTSRSRTLYALRTFAHDRVEDSSYLLVLDSATLDTSHTVCPPTSQERGCHSAPAAFESATFESATRRHAPHPA